MWWGRGCARFSLMIILLICLVIQKTFLYLHYPCSSQHTETLAVVIYYLCYNRGNWLLKGFAHRCASLQHSLCFMSAFAIIGLRCFKFEQKLDNVDNCLQTISSSLSVYLHQHVCATLPVKLWALLLHL